ERNCGEQRINNFKDHGGRTFQFAVGIAVCKNSHGSERLFESHEKEHGKQSTKAHRDNSVTGNGGIPCDTGNEQYKERYQCEQHHKTGSAQVSYGERQQVDFFNFFQRIIKEIEQSANG